MYRKLFKVALIAVFLFMFFPINVSAAAITLNGNFDDWASMPQLSDKIGDADPTSDIVLLKWYPDVKDGKLYFYCERSSGSYAENERKDNRDNEDNRKIIQDWAFTVYLKVDGVQKKANVYYNAQNQKAEVYLYDWNGRFLWSGGGKWGEDKLIGKRVEFYIPFNYLTNTVVSGYQIDTYFVSGKDRVPDGGFIMISTVSTFPIQNTAALFIVLAAVYFILFKEKLNVFWNYFFLLGNLFNIFKEN